MIASRPALVFLCIALLFAAAAIPGLSITALLVALPIFAIPLLVFVLPPAPVLVHIARKPVLRRQCPRPPPAF